MWEPILVTDWKKPGNGVAERITDKRVRQFWDAQHLVATKLAKDARPPQPEAECCTSNGILWDLVAVYPPEAIWTDKVPPATMFNGPVAHLERDIEGEIRRLQRE